MAKLTLVLKFRFHWHGKDVLDGLVYPNWLVASILNKTAATWLQTSPSLRWLFNQTTKLLHVEQLTQLYICSAHSEHILFEFLLLSMPHEDCLLNSDWGLPLLLVHSIPVLHHSDKQFVHVGCNNSCTLLRICKHLSSPACTPPCFWLDTVSV